MFCISQTERKLSAGVIKVSETLIFKKKKKIFIRPHLRMLMNASHIYAVFGKLVKNSHPLQMTNYCIKFVITLLITACEKQSDY